MISDCIVDVDIIAGSQTTVETEVVVGDSPVIDLEGIPMPIIKEEPKIESISVNGVEQPIVDKNVDIPVPTKTSDLTNDSNFVMNEALAQVAKSGDYNDLENTPYIPSTEGLASEEYVDESISSHNSSEEAHQDIRDSIPSIEGLASETFVGNAVSSHNTDEDSHSDIRTEVSLVKDIAEGANIAIVFNNYLDLVTFFNTESDSLKVGTNLYVKTLEVPDLWVSSIESSSVSYTYTTDSDFLTYINGNGQIGYYKFSELETQKVDLNNYATLTDLGGKVSKAGDTMTGNLNLGQNSLLIESPTENYSSKIYNDTSGLNLMTSGNGSTYASALKLYNSQNKAIFRRDNIYTGSTEDEDHRLQDGADIDNKLADYLPLAGGEITGDITFQGQPNTHQYIKFFKDDTGLYNFAIRNPYNGGRIEIGRIVRSSGVYTEFIRITYAQDKGVVAITSGELYVGQPSLIENKAQKYSDIYKQGIVSQTQTWSGSDSTGYSYTMSNQVTGDIPIEFIRRWNTVAAKYASTYYPRQFNEETGYFEANGLTDISYEEAIMILEESQPLIGQYMPIYNYSRTNFAGTSPGTTAARNWQLSSSEVAYQGIISWNGTNLATQFVGSTYLTTILNWNAQYYSTSFTISNCPSLKNIIFRSNTMGFKINVTITGCPNLTLQSVVNMVNSATNGSTAITFKFDQAVYNKCILDTAQYTYGGQTYTGIIAYAAARHISIASA